MKRRHSSRRKADHLPFNDAEWQRDWAIRNYDAVMDIVKSHYGAYG